MQGTGVISLHPKDILSMAQLRKSLDRKTFQKFSSLVEGGCVPMHVPESGRPRPASVYMASAFGHPVRELRLPQSISEKARAVNEDENGKLRVNGIEGGWIDGEKLAVYSMGHIGPDLSLLVNKMRWSEIIAIRELDFHDIVSMRAIRLGINNHLLADDGGHQIVVLSRKGKKPGNLRMGDEMIRGISEMPGQLMASVNGSIDADSFGKENEDGVWAPSVYKEMKEELGIPRPEDLRYLGAMMDASMYRGVLAIAGIAHTKLSLMQIDDLRALAPDGSEILSLEPLALERDAVASMLKLRRDEMQPQLITALVLLGYEKWGYDFLKKADK